MIQVTQVIKIIVQGRVDIEVLPSHAVSVRVSQRKYMWQQEPASAQVNSVQRTAYNMADPNSKTSDLITVCDDEITHDAILFVGLQ
jgi:hypothetical protein